MPSLKEVLRNQPYPCFKVESIPGILAHQLKKGMLCLYDIDRRIFDFPMVGEIGPAEELFGYLDFVGYYSIEDFRDLVFAGRLPVSCPSCKGPVEEAGLASFELEETGMAEVELLSGDAEMFICELCRRPFALMPIP